MIQKTYHLQPEKIEEAIRQIRSDGVLGGPRRSMILVYEYLADQEKMREHAEALRTAFPGVRTLSVSMLKLSVPEIDVPEETVVSVFTFEKSGFEVFRYDCSRMGEDQAARQLAADLDALEDVKGVLCLTAGEEPSLDLFFEGVPSKYSDVPIFGLPAAVYDLDAGSRPVVIADGEACRDTIVAVAFCGKDLHIETGFGLGYRALGPQMTVTDGDGSGYVKAIDHLTPV